MVVWQVDFYRRPLQDEQKNPLWELVLCSEDKTFAAYGFCPQPEATSDWIVAQLKNLMADGVIPERLDVFRPQSLGPIQTAATQLNIPVMPTRHAPALKQYLQERATVYPTLPQYTKETYEPIAIESPPPVPIPDMLWGDRWRFASMNCGDMEPFFKDKPIPILEFPPYLNPIKQGIASTTVIPGVVINGGRQSMRLARWLKEQRPVALHYIPGEPDGLILDTGLCDRLILTTFDDPEVRNAAIAYQERLSASNGLHFLLIQPDDSGMTYSGMWLLHKETS